MRQPSVDSHDHDHHKVSADDPTVVSTEHSNSCHDHDLHHAVMRQPSVDSHDHDHHKVSADVPTTVQMSMLIVVMVMVMIYTMLS